MRFLMCPPDAYDVSYVINPWMEGNVKKSSPQAAMGQWLELTRILKERAEIELIPPQPGLPDLVFTANAGLVLGNVVILSRFLHPERQGEEPHFKEWFLKHRYKVRELPKDLPFKGAGDALLDREGRWLWAGYGFRSELNSHPYLAKWLDIEVISLRLIDKRFYHLDTCFCPLEDGFLLYYPSAFDAYSNRLIEMRVPEEKRIAVVENDAANFACNALNLDCAIFLNKASAQLKEKLGVAGFDVREVPITEFMKAGGGVKCLTLRLTEPVRSEIRAGATVESRLIELRGHLLDSGLLDGALDATVEAGGSFQIVEFNLGKQRQSTSSASIKISAPSNDVLEKILGRLIDLGAVLAPSELKDARLETVTQAGVAPEDFYATTIYPTEVRLNGHWRRVERQRMDSVIVVIDAADGASAVCQLLRELEVGDRVVTGVDGIRTVRKTESRDNRGSPSAADDFKFMGAGVSSERRVELVVERIAWEMRRIRDQAGKVIVVAGPVVIHTGAGEHLARLIREGYVQTLLGGNAIAVHDIEQALFGTSLGVDLRRGTPAQGGHHHHLRAINTIRRCGSIARAVEQGILTSGIFYECVRKGVPFSLAGSIRDDGPMPETRMDLEHAQEEHAKLLAGVDLILMLSSMLHAIGVGNMTPAGVKLVCVDINPAVVTKLSDRGSVESIGVVTDVGLFLSRLVQQLGKLEGVYVQQPTFQQTEH